MFSIFLRAVIFGLGVEIGRDIYRKVKEKTIDREVPQSAEHPVTKAHDQNDVADEDSETHVDVGENETREGEAPEAEKKDEEE